MHWLNKQDVYCWLLRFRCAHGWIFFYMLDRASRYFQLHIFTDTVAVTDKVTAQWSVMEVCFISLPDVFLCLWYLFVLFKCALSLAKYNQTNRINAESKVIQTKSGVEPIGKELCRSVGGHKCESIIVWSVTLLGLQLVCLDKHFFERGFFDSH